MCAPAGRPAAARLAGEVNPHLSLPQTFIQQQGGECAPLLDALLRHGWLVGELAVHLTPGAADADTYVRLYEAVTRVQAEQASLALVLLSKVSGSQ